jgi:hypothetical protein
MPTVSTESEEPYSNASADSNGHADVSGHTTERGYDFKAYTTRNFILFTFLNMFSANWTALECRKTD